MDKAYEFHAAFMAYLPEDILAAILAMLSISEGGAISVVCRYWNRVLRDFVHRTIRELNVPKTASDVMIRAIVARFQRLASLDLTDCFQVSDVGVQAICAGCPSLTSLNLFHCEEVSDVGVQAIGAGCPSLTSIDLSRCRQVSDVGVQAISAGCPSLTSIDLRDCNVSDVGVPVTSFC